MGVCKLTIGNGFDLFCSLKTRYKDFFESEKQKRIFNSIDYFENEWSDDIKNFSDSFISFFDDETTIWDILFYKEPGKKQRNNWCDVEKFIFDFFYEKNNKEENLFNKIYTNVRENIKKGTLFFDDNWYKVACIYMVLKNVPTHRKDDFIAFLLDELQRFESKFGLYVNQEFENKEKIYSIFYRHFFSDCIPKNMSVISLDSFNYTPIENYSCDSFYSHNNEKIYLPGNIKHINGDYRNPIFGIDSSKFKVSDAGHVFTKTYRRITADFFEGDNFDIALDEKFEDLVIFGHSLNEQDYNYFFPIFDFMKLMDVMADSKLYFLYYIYDGNSKNKIKKENVKNLYSMLNAYEEYKTGKTKDYRLVDTLSSRGRLRFKEVVRPSVN